MAEKQTNKERLKDITDRLWLHEVDRKTLEEIAALEKVTFQSVHESIESAKKKILKKF